VGVDDPAGKLGEVMDVIGYVALKQEREGIDDCNWRWVSSSTDVNTFDTYEEALAELRMRSLEELFIAALLDDEADRTEPRRSGELWEVEP
jgi:hypothetical protein